MADAVLPPLLHAAAEADGHGAVLPRHKPDLALGQPDVGQLKLLAVDDALTEKAVFVQNGEAARRVCQRRERVHKAGGETSQPAVAEAGVGLLFINRVQIEAQVGERLAVRLLETEVIQIQPQRAADQKLQTDIIHALLLAGLNALGKRPVLLRKDVAHSQHRGLIDLFLAGLGGGHPEIARQLADERIPDLFLLDHRFSPFLFLSSIRRTALYTAKPSGSM